MLWHTYVRPTYKFIAVNVVDIFIDGVEVVGRIK